MEDYTFLLTQPKKHNTLKKSAIESVLAFSKSYKVVKSKVLGQTGLILN